MAIYKFISSSRPTAFCIASYADAL